MVHVSMQQTAGAAGAAGAAGQPAVVYGNQLPPRSYARCCCACQQPAQRQQRVSSSQHNQQDSRWHFSGRPVHVAVAALPGMGRPGAGLGPGSPFTLGTTPPTGPGAGGWSQGVRPGMVGRHNSRNTTNTSLVHGTGQEVDVSEQAAAVVEELWQAAISTTAAPAGPPPAPQQPGVQGGGDGDDTASSSRAHRGRQTVELLLPCMPGALLERASNEVSLRMAADLLSRLSLAHLNTQEQQVLALFSSLLSRSHDAEPEERAPRNALLRAMWDGFAAARVSGSVGSPVVGPMLFELQHYRQQYRGRTLAALRVLLAEGPGLAPKAVLLRTLLRGNLSQVVLRHPQLCTAPLDMLRTVAQQLEAQDSEQAACASGAPQVAAVLRDQPVIHRLLSRDQDQERVVKL